MKPPVMAMIETRRMRSGLAGLVVVLALAACGGTQRSVPVPGASPIGAASSPSDGDRFTRAPSPTAADDAVVPVAPAASSGPSVPAPEPFVPTSSVDVPPATTEPQSTSVVRPTSPIDGVPEMVMPSVSGWAAFDLHLMTILDAGSPAVSATVMRDGDVVHEVALGARSSAGGPVTVGDRYRVASISKVVTAITVLRLVEQGVVGLDEPVGERIATHVGIASPVAGVDQITTRHLLTHRSGIAQYENLMFRRQVESCGQAAATGLGRDLERAPGTTLRYSNLNFCMLGLLVEDLTGRAYGDVVRHELLTPLGIDGMRLAGTFDVADTDVEHRSDEGRNYMEVLGAAGSWIASPTEVVTIIDSLDHTTPGWKPLSPETAVMMRTITEDPPLPPEVATSTSTTLEPPPPPSRGYGMGLMIFGPDAFGHTGTLESTHAMTVRQDDGLTWAITVSGDHPSSSRDLASVMAQGLRYSGI